MNVWSKEQNCGRWTMLWVVLYCFTEVMETRGGDAIKVRYSWAAAMWQKLFQGNLKGEEEGQQLTNSRGGESRSFVNHLNTSLHKNCSWMHYLQGLLHRIICIKVMSWKRIGFIFPIETAALILYFSFLKKLQNAQCGRR